MSPEIASSQQMPLKPEIFHGRESLVGEIAELLMVKKTSPVAMFGAGGMGKTSVALAVAQSPLIQAHFPRGKRVWVPCIGASSTALLLEILYVQLQIPGDDTTRQHSKRSSRTQDHHLVLLEIFETTWNSLGTVHKEVEDILRQLAEQSHVAILLTMRPTDEEASLRIFHDVNPYSKDDPVVRRLLRVLGCMPFTVALMASLGNEGQATAAELLEACLSVDSHLVQQNCNAILLLGILSLLPEGTTKENLRWWAPTLNTSMIPSAIATLSRAALLIEDKRQHHFDSSVLFVVPLVQSFMQHSGRIPDDLQRQMLSIWFVSNGTTQLSEYWL
ncbi:hypothetical protein CVT26_010000 [Gymnopilus dilepis]|uniref:Novel STAND NTPase 1 domain-containing protein n=1 Tax=Gymnopilus dilepis TaxID=231916 RepID=A0A409VL21_9AGAR|nr:hypothetical protein CVT26_010000 [Gymnopilus dilepis]